MRENVIDALSTVLTADEQLAGQAPGVDDEPLVIAAFSAATSVA